MKTCDDWLVEAFHARRLELPERALEAFAQALSLEPGDPGILMEMARCYFGMGEIRAGREVAEQIHGIADDESDFWLEMGKVWTQGGDAERADTCLAKVMPGMPEFSEALVQRALLMERTGKWADFSKANANLTLTARWLVDGIRAESGGDTERAMTTYRQLIASGKDPLSEVEAGYRLARLGLRSGRTEEAIQVLERCKRIEDAKWPMEDQSHQISDRRRYDCDLLDALPADWFAGRVTPAEAESLILLGHPRSGTSLLAKHLAEAGGLVWVDEAPAFEVAARRWIRSHPGAAEPAGLLEALRGISPANAAEFGRDYRERLRDFARDSGSRRLLDKNPGIGTSWHALHALLPNVGWIMTLRHPLAIALSCYSQRFGLTMLGASCRTWNGTLAAVQHGLEAWCRVRDQLPEGSILTVRYEDFVMDPHAHMECLLPQIGGDPRADGESRVCGPVLNITPSHADIQKPVDSAAVGRWVDAVGLLGHSDDKKWHRLIEDLGYLA